MRLLRALTALALTLPFASALPKIHRKGKYLYDPSGNRFFIKGVAYQPQGELAAESESNSNNGGFPEPSSYIDPLSSGTNCTRDVPYLKDLGVNTIRVYSVNSQLDHDACMALLNQAGIYVLLDVSLPLNGSIDRASPSWSTNLMNEYLTTINKFEAYENVLGYNVGNEVVTVAANTHALPFVKAAARDVKSYLRSINSTALVGYAATDGAAAYRTAISEFLTCGNDSVTVDLFGLNSYSWCGESTASASGWTNLLSDFDHLTVPVYMSEFGCNKSPPRVWNEVTDLLSAPMSDLFSGGVAFSYFPANDPGYELVDISGSTVTPNADYQALKAMFNSTQGPNSPSESSANQTDLTCPEESANLLASTKLPPTPNQSVCECVNSKALACHAIPATARNPLIVGPLIDYACSLLGDNATASCATSIGSNGTTGVYGPLSMCSPEIKLNWVMSFYTITDQQATSCDFSGNATIVSGLPTDSSANDIASECLKGNSPVLTPTATDKPAPPAETDPAQISIKPDPTGTDTTSSGTTNKNAAASAFGAPAVGVVFAVVGVVLGASVVA